MTYDFATLNKVADAVIHQYRCDLPRRNCHSFQMRWSGKVVSKERPRGKQHYTPKKTRDFEKALGDAATEIRDAVYKGAVINWPCSAELNVYDEIPKNWPIWQQELARQRLLFPPRGDLDNKTKAILDAFNETVYTDDSLIVSLRAERCYAHGQGFSITLHPVGITRAELSRLEHIVRAKKNGHC